MKSVKTILFEAFAALSEEKQIKGLEILISDPGARNVLVRAMREALVGSRVSDTSKVPDSIEVPVTVPTPVVAEPKKVVAVSISSPELVKEELPPAPKQVPVPAPPRVVEMEKGEKTFNTENGYKTWTGFLKGVVNGSNVPWLTLQGLMVKLVESGWQFSEDDFGLFFVAARKADQMKKFIVSDKASAIYRQAPPEMLAAYLFERDGKLSQIMGQLDSSQSGKIPSWLVANIFVFASAVEALDENGGLDDKEATRLKGLLDKVDSLNGPKNLIGRLATFFVGDVYSDKNPVPPATATIGDLLAAKNGKKSVTIS